MKEFLKELFAYHHHFNQKLIEQFLEFGPQLAERSYPLFCHSMNAQQIWNARITESKKFAVHQVHPLENCQAIDRENYLETLQIIDEYELSKTVVYQNSKGDEFQNSVQDILFHVANHFSHHRGQIISDFRQSGVEPLVTDYIFYKR